MKCSTHLPSELLIYEPFLRFQNGSVYRGVRRPSSILVETPNLSPCSVLVTFVDRGMYTGSYVPFNFSDAKDNVPSILRFNPVEHERIHVPYIV